MGTEQGLLTLDNRSVCCVVQPSRRCQLKLNEVVGFGNQRVSHPSNGAAPPPKLRPSSPGYRQYVEAFLATQGGQSPRVEVRSVPHGSLVLVFYWPHSWGCGTFGEGGGQPAALFSQPKVSSPDLDPPPQQRKVQGGEGAASDAFVGFLCPPSSPTGCIRFLGTVTG